MPVIIVDLLFAVLTISAGAAAGWWLRSMPTSGSANMDAEQLRRIQELLARLREVAAGVAANVGEHTHRMEEINEELSGADAQDADAVLAAVDKLVTANTEMQQRLASADEKLREQARLIETHAAEARTDPLTSLANRRAFDDEMARRISELTRQGRGFSVMMMDVDHFKKFNDMHGHQAGDAVLCAIADVFRANARGMDLVARYGGEEFAVIFPGTRTSDANIAALRFCEAIRTTAFRFGGNTLRVTASFGVAGALPEDTADSVVKRADTALYSSKSAGRDCVHWHDGETIRLVQAEKHEQPEPVEQVLEAIQPQPEPATETNQTRSKRKTDSDPSSGAKTSVPKAPMAATQEPSDRTTFFQTLRQRLAEWRRGGATPGVLLIRVDGYQQLVQKHDREVGQMVLGATARFIHAAIRDMDLLCRYDTASYGILLPNVQISDLVGIAERLREAIARCPLPLPDGQLRFTVSIAGTTAMEGDDATALLNHSVEALDAALKSGGNNSYFHDGRQTASAKALAQLAS